MTLRAPDERRDGDRFHKLRWKVGPGPDDAGRPTTRYVELVCRHDKDRKEFWATACHIDVCEEERYRIETFSSNSFRFSIRREPVPRFSQARLGLFALAAEADLRRHYEAEPALRRAFGEEVSHEAA